LKAWPEDIASRLAPGVRRWGKVARNKTAHQIDFDHGFEAIGREIFGRRDEIAGRARDDEIERAQMIGCDPNSLVERREIADIGRKRQGLRPEGGNLFDRALGLARVTPQQRQPGAACRKAARYRQVDAAGAAGDECCPTGKDVLAENGAIMGIVAHRMIIPPFTLSVWPVMCPLAGRHRKPAALARSSASRTTPMGLRTKELAIAVSIASRVLQRLRVIGVSMIPGESTLQVTPAGPPSMAAMRPSAATAALVEA
jgi:hypothetical protein